MASLFRALKRIYTGNVNPPWVPKESSALKFGILGAANIAPDALIKPAKSHPDVIVYAVAARDPAKAQAFARKHSILKVFSGSQGYQELLNDPDVEVIYIPLPNGLHYEWAMKALSAGKHVLLEKPAANTADETRALFEIAEKKGLVLLEAFHYRFHPAIQRVKQILSGGELGAIKTVEASLALTSGLMKADDIRFKYSLGGGAMMDVGTYTLNCVRYLVGEPLSILSTEMHALNTDANIDTGGRITLALPNSATGMLINDLKMPWRWGIFPTLPRIYVRVKCDGGEVELTTFVMPALWHSLTVAKAGPKGSRGTSVEKVYKFKDENAKGEEWWTTYRYQLEAFVDKVRSRIPQTWVDAEDSIENQRWIDQVYEKSGMDLRPKSTYINSA